MHIFSNWKDHAIAWKINLNESKFHTPRYRWIITIPHVINDNINRINRPGRDRAICWSYGPIVTDYRLRVLTKLLTRHYGDGCWSSQNQRSRFITVIVSTVEQTKEQTQNHMRREREPARDCQPDDDASSLAFGLDGQSGRMDR